MKEWLRKIREERGLTQEQVAESAGISRTYYTNIENGNRCEQNKNDTEKNRC